MTIKNLSLLPRCSMKGVGYDSSLLAMAIVSFSLETSILSKTFKCAVSLPGSLNDFPAVIIIRSGAGCARYGITRAL